MRSARWTAVTVSVAVGVSLSLTACTSAGMPVPSSSGSNSASPSASAVKPRNVPKYDAKGTAKENLPYFLMTLNNVYSSGVAAETPSEDMATGLANAGFDPSTMQISENATALGLVADSKYVSVVFNGECIVGTWGAAHSAPTATVLPLLPQGGCLIGGTNRSFQ